MSAPLVSQHHRLANTLEFVVDYHAAHEVAPSYRDILTACGQGSLQTVKNDLNRLVDAGQLRWAPGLPAGSQRAILPVKEPS